MTFIAVIPRKMDRKTPTGFSEIDFLRNVVPQMSRLLVGKTKRENIWKRMHAPKDWPYTWKNPTTPKKDTLEELQLKLQELRSRISVEMLLPYQDMFKLYDEGMFEDLQDFIHVYNISEKINKVNTVSFYIKSSRPEVICKKNEVLAKLQQLISSLQGDVTHVKHKRPCKRTRHESHATVKSVSNTTLHDSSVAPQSLGVLNMTREIQHNPETETAIYVSQLEPVSSGPPGDFYHPFVNEHDGKGSSHMCNSTEMFNTTDTDRQLLASHTDRQLLGSHTDRQLLGSHTNRQLLGSHTDRQLSLKTDNQQFGRNSGSHQHGLEPLDSHQHSQEPLDSYQHSIEPLDSHQQRLEYIESLQHSIEEPLSHQSLDSGIWSNIPSVVNDDELRIYPERLASPDLNNKLRHIFNACI